MTLRVHFNLHHKCTIYILQCLNASITGRITESLPAYQYHTKCSFAQLLFCEIVVLFYFYGGGGGGGVQLKLKINLCSIINTCLFVL